MTALAPMTFSETVTLAEMFAKSNYFADAKSAAQALVKIEAGRELGFPPMASMSGVHIIKGRPSISAHMMASLIKKSGRYDYRVRQLDREVCELEFFERNHYAQSASGFESVGKVRYTLKEAIECGLATTDVWKRYSDDLLFARCVSKGFRRYCPDLTLSGGLIYTTEEMEDEQTPVKPDVVVQSVTTNPPAQIAPPKPVEPTPEPARITDELLTTLTDLIRETNTEAVKVCAYYKVPVLAKLTPEQGEQLRVQLLTKKTQQAPVKAPPDPRMPLMEQIDQLTIALGVSQEDFLNRLEAGYGSRDVTTLTVEHLEQLVKRMTNSLKTRQAKPEKGAA